MRSGDGKYEWREDSKWPLSDTKFLELYLDASSEAVTGLLSFAAPESTGVLSYSAEAPRDLTKVGPCAIFESSPLAEEIEIAGPMSAILWVSASAKDMDLYTVLRVLDTDGKEASYAVMPLAKGCPLSHGSLKVSHRATDPKLSTIWRPWHTHLENDYAPLFPDEVVSVHIEMTLTTARVARGYRFQLIIEPYSGHSETTWRAYGGIASGESQAKDNRNTVGGRPYDNSYHEGVENRIHTGPNYLSKLLIPSVTHKYHGDA
jgi:predicted acyl esterase